MIRDFLKCRPDTIAVAVQKRPEVPGFHRSYWKLYQDFPGRIKIVVLEDGAPHDDAAAARVQAQMEWVKKEIDAGRLFPPETWDGPDDRYLKLAVEARLLQGSTSSMIVMNGGLISCAQAAIETIMPQSQSPVQWTVYP